VTSRGDSGGICLEFDLCILSRFVGIAYAYLPIDQRLRELVDCLDTLAAEGQ